jgi:hypothetical protein
MNDDIVVQVLLDSVREQQRQLTLAVNRRKRASTALAKADHDIASISGALMALQDVARRFHAPLPEPEKGPHVDITGASATKIYQTLAGPISEHQPTPDPQES